ncbi:MAG: hypothetical protein ACI9PU_002341, partial [Ascidiaceihabitans sp.]
SASNVTIKCNAANSPWVISFIGISTCCEF